MRRGPGGNEKEWIDCVQSNVGDYVLAGDWKVTALEADVWVEIFTEGGHMFMAAWREKEVEASRYCQEERQREWESCYRQRHLLRTW